MAPNETQCCEVKKESLISAEINGLDNLIAVMNDNINAVYIMLKPILRNEPDSIKESGKADVSSVPLVNVLDGFRYRLDTINNIIVGIKNKIEV